VRIAQSRKSAIPKFDSPAWLAIGTLAGVVLIIDGLWSIIAQHTDPFFPFQVGRLFRMAFGIGLMIHCTNLLRVNLGKEKLLAGAVSWFKNRITWYTGAFRIAWLEKSFKIGVLACSAGIVVALLAGIGMTKLVILVAIALVGWGLEIMNSGMEHLMNNLSSGHDPVVKRVKDAFGAAPAFTYSAFWISWIILVVPTLYNLLIRQIFTIGN